MRREEIEAFQQRITLYLERHDDKKELAAVCRMAAVFADVIERNADLLPRGEQLRDSFPPGDDHCIE